MQTVPSGAFGRGSVLNRATTGNYQQGVALVNQGVRSGIDDLENVQLRMDQQKNVRKYKLPIAIPAATALARIYQAVGSALENKATVARIGAQVEGATVCLTDREVNVPMAYTTTAGQKELDLATVGSNYQAAILLTTGKSGEQACQYCYFGG